MLLVDLKNTLVFQRKGFDISLFFQILITALYFETLPAI